MTEMVVRNNVLISNRGELEVAYVGYDSIRGRKIIF